jgi:hypothetical protein
MDVFFALIGFCLLTEFFYLVRTWKPLPFSRTGNLIAGLVGIAGVGAMVLMLNAGVIPTRFEDILLPTFGWAFRGWAVALVLLLGLLENVALLGMVIFWSKLPSATQHRRLFAEDREALASAPAVTMPKSPGIPNAEAMPCVEDAKAEVNDVNLVAKLQGRGMLMDLGIFIILDEKQIAAGSVIKGAKANVSIAQGLHSICVSAFGQGKKMSKVLTFTAKSGQNIEIAFNYSRSWGNYKADITGTSGT